MSSLDPAGRRRVVAVALGLVASAGAILVLAQLVDASAAWLILKDANLLLVSAATVSLGFSMAVRTARWHAVLPSIAGKPTVRTLLPHVVVGYAANAVMPLRAGDAARGIMAAHRFRLGVPETLGSVGLERLLDGLALAVVLLVASIGVVVPSWFTQAIVIVALCTASIVAALVLFGGIARSRRRQGQNVGQRFWQGARADNRGIGRALGWSFLAWGVDGVTFWLCAVALGLTISPVVALLVAGGAAIGSVAPSAPAALGTFELAGTAVAVALGMDPSGAFALVVLAHAVTVVPIATAAIAVVSVGVRSGSSDVKSVAGEAGATIVSPESAS